MEVRSHIKGLAIKLGEVGWSGLPVLGDWQGISWLVVSNCICAITCFVYFIFLFFFFFLLNGIHLNPKFYSTQKFSFFPPPILFSFLLWGKQAKGCVVLVCLTG